jgi:hypothetical protein
MRLTDVIVNSKDDNNNNNNIKYHDINDNNDNNDINDNTEDDDDMCHPKSIKNLQTHHQQTDNTNNWTDKQEKLLIKWAEKAAGYRWLHNTARMKFKRFHDYLSYPTIILSSITGVGGFAVLNPSSSTEVSTSNQMKILIIQYLFAFMNVISSIINSIAKFTNSMQLSESHSSLCVQYSKFYRNIDMELSLEKNNRVNAVKFVARCRQEYDRMLSESPDIPYDCIQLFNKSFPDKEVKPDVCNGLNIISCPTPRSDAFRMHSWVKKAKEASHKKLEIKV